MTHSPLTDQIRLSAQSSSRNGSAIDTFLIHHQAGTNDDATINAMVSGSKEVSANYTISNEGRLTCVVDEDLRAWTSGSSSDGGRGAAWDRRSITVEIENESGAPDWRISDAAIAKAAALLNDLRQRYGITNVLGHRDLWTQYQASYPTYCPGPDTVDRILAVAGGLPTPPPVTPPAATENEWVLAPGGEPNAPYWPKGPLMARIQAALKARGRYDGIVDGEGGELTAKGIQITLNVSGKNGGVNVPDGSRPTDVDGRLGINNAFGVQEYARDFGDYDGLQDGDPREGSWTGFALGLERP